MKILTIEEAAAVRQPPAYSPYGYIITEDGKTYALLERWTHGVVLAVLFPELAKEKGYEPPVYPLEENDVFKYQRFELENHTTLPVVRVANGRLLSPVAISKGDADMTGAQIESLRAVFKELGIGPRDEVATDYGECPMSKCIDRMQKGWSYE